MVQLLQREMLVATSGFKLSDLFFLPHMAILMSAKTFDKEPGGNIPMNGPNNAGRNCWDNLKHFSQPWFI